MAQIVLMCQYAKPENLLLGTKKWTFLHFHLFLERTQSRIPIFFGGQGSEPNSICKLFDCCKPFKMREKSPITNLKLSG